MFPAFLAVNPKKIYCIDHSLVTSVSSGILVNSGHLLENLVFNALRRTSEEIQVAAGTIHVVPAWRFLLDA